MPGKKEAGKRAQQRKAFATKLIDPKYLHDHGGKDKRIDSFELYSDFPHGTMAWKHQYMHR